MPPPPFHAHWHIRRERKRSREINRERERQRDSDRDKEGDGKRAREEERERETARGEPRYRKLEICKNTPSLKIPSKMTDEAHIATESGLYRHTHPDPHIHPRHKRGQRTFLSDGHRISWISPKSVPDTDSVLAELSSTVFTSVPSAPPKMPVTSAQSETNTREMYSSRACLFRWNGFPYSNTDPASDRLFRNKKCDQQMIK